MSAELHEDEFVFYKKEQTIQTTHTSLALGLDRFHDELTNIVIMTNGEGGEDVDKIVSFCRENDAEFINVDRECHFGHDNNDCVCFIIDEAKQDPDNKYVLYVNKSLKKTNTACFMDLPIVFLNVDVNINQEEDLDEENTSVQTFGLPEQLVELKNKKLKQGDVTIQVLEL